MNIKEIDIVLILKKVVTAFLVDFKNHSFFDDSTYTPEDINGGDCYNFAAVVKYILPDSQIYSTRKKGGHVIIKIGNRFYDAAHIKGSLNWKSIDKDYAAYKNIEDVYDLIDERTLYKEWRISKSYINRILKLIGS